jgi:hypothetical protein
LGLPIIGLIYSSHLIYFLTETKFKIFKTLLDRKGTTMIFVSMLIVRVVMVFFSPLARLRIFIVTH